MSKSELERIKDQTDFNSIEILEAHNKWRRGADIEMQSSYLIGLSIDEAIDAFKRLAEVEYKLQEETDYTEQLKNMLSGCEAALKESRANDMDSICQLNEQKVRADAAEEKLKAFEWQPIETAPKDCSILIYDGETVMEAFWFGSWYLDKNKKGWMPANLDEEYGDYINATHWMPLPKAPNP